MYHNRLEDKPKICDVYIRKSNDRDDKQIQSLETQERIAKQIASKYKLKIGKIFKETKSAKRPDKRPQFDELMRRIESGECDGIICWHVNRLSRNYKENGLVHQALEDGKIKAIYTDDRIYTKDDDLILDVESSMNARYSKDLQRTVRDGAKTKLLKGEFPAKPPLGYVNDRFEKIISPDSENWHKVRRLWDMILTGAYTMPAIREEAKRLNIRLRNKKHKVPAINTLRDMFKNPFYYGYMKWNGELYKGNHKAMVTKDEWDRVQIFLHNQHNTRPKTKEYANHLFRGMLYCEDCGFAIVTEVKQKTLSDKSINKYHYCRCSGKRKDYNCSWNGYEPEEKLLKQVKDELCKYTITPEIYNLAIDALNEEEDMSADNDRLREIRERLSDIMAMQDKLTDEYLAGRIPERVHSRKQEEFENEIKYLEEEKKQLESPRIDWRKLVGETLDFARYAREDFEKDSLENRKTIMRMLGDHITVSPVGRTINFNPVKWLEPVKKAVTSKSDTFKSGRTNDLQRSNCEEPLQKSSWLPRPDSNWQPRS